MVKNVSGEIQGAHMFHRGVVLLAVLAVAPAHAALIEYSFTAQLTGAAGISTLEAFGLNPYGDFVTGGFLFDDAAPRTSYAESQNIVGASSSTYDVSNLRLWVNVGDYVLTTTGVSLAIQDDPATLCGPYCRKDTWTLSLRGDGDEVNGYTVQGGSINLWQYGGDGQTSSELQVPDMTQWDHPLLDVRSFEIGFTNHTRLSGWLKTITPATTSVPEPATLSLLAVGALGAVATRRRRQVAANA